jgi:hypothetical protein
MLLDDGNIDTPDNSEAAIRHESLLDAARELVGGNVSSQEWIDAMNEVCPPGPYTCL